MNLVHFGYFFFERATGERDLERRLLIGAGLAVLEALGARILALRVAPDAVVHLIQRMVQVHAFIGEREAFALPPMRFRKGRRRWRYAAAQARRRGRAEPEEGPCEGREG